MADYIYLLQNRLTAAQQRALEAVRDAARAQGMPVFLVGGAVRDLTSGAPVRDLDFAVQGDVRPLRETLEAAEGSFTGEAPVLQAQYVLFPGGVRVEVGPTLSVSYPKPGEPEVHPAAILDDLRRRDFTANAMAISLNEGSYGLLLDPLNGAADTENRELRLVSPYGFLEQPALLLRAARLADRLGWTLEQRTEQRYANAKDEDAIATLTAWDRGYELEEVFHEEDPLAALEHLYAEGWREALFPALDPAKADREAVDRVHDLVGQMEQIGLHPDASAVLFPLLTGKLSPGDAEALKALFPGTGFRARVESLEARGKELAARMLPKSGIAASETWKLLFAAEPEVVLWIACNSRSPEIKARLKSLLHDWPQARQRIPYALMQEMRITPDLPGYDGLLEDLFFALIDGKLATPDATRAFLEPFSPPAPVVQAAPRRRAAKGTRSRGRKAQGDAAAPEDKDDEAIESRDREDEEEGEQAPRPKATPAPEPPVKTASSGKAAAARPGGAASAKKTEPMALSAAVADGEAAAVAEAEKGSSTKKSAATSKAVAVKPTPDTASPESAAKAVSISATSPAGRNPAVSGTQGVAPQKGTVPAKAPAATKPVIPAKSPTPSKSAVPVKSAVAAKPSAPAKLPVSAKSASSQPSTAVKSAPETRGNGAVSKPAPVAAKPNAKLEVKAPGKAATPGRPLPASATPAAAAPKTGKAPLPAKKTVAKGAAKASAKAAPAKAVPAKVVAKGAAKTASKTASKAAAKTVPVAAKKTAPNQASAKPATVKGRR